ncbi:MAG TPA: efflux RND transporter periplasmic adaptor subunit [Bacteroidia bacterium]|jgi:membrane fusion protein (multidrug efflux system)|nr:efflux RND transporter periplasmic adaptor subunit [Bacteroidia bacterium]
MTSELRINTMSNMKNAIIYLSLATLAVSCGAPDKKAALEKLKKQRSEIETKITTLEEEIKKAGGDTVKEKTLEVIATAITPQTFKTYIEVQGRIDADENVSLSSEMPGTITQIHVKVGEEVSKGQVLAETDAKAIQQQMSDLQTNLDLATQVYQKQKNLWDQKIGTEIQFLQSKTSKESLEKKMGALQEQLRMSKIISPINGTVDAVNIKIGQMVAPGLPAINVVNFSNLKVKADVAESYASRIKKGNEVVVYFPDMNDSVTSKINYSSRAINALSRTFGVEILLDGTKEYHPNMVAKLKINDYQSPTPIVVVPVKYIQRGTAENYVFVVNGNKAAKKVIKTGREYNGIAEVTQGLAAGDQLITAGYDLVNDGDAVSVKK